MKSLDEIGDAILIIWRIFMGFWSVFMLYIAMLLPFLVCIFISVLFLV